MFCNTALQRANPHLAIAGNLLRKRSFVRKDTSLKPALVQPCGQAGEPINSTVCRMKDSELSIEQATEALAAREPIFHRPEFGTSRADFEAMVAPEFWEIGASGRRYSKSFVFDTLESRHSMPVSESYIVTDFICQELLPNLYLAAYQLDQEGRLSQRSTIWRRSSGAWQIVFHQGTLIAG